MKREDLFCDNIMHYDGTALIVVDTTGRKYFKVDTYTVDHRLSDAVSEDDFIEQLGGQLPEGLTDALVNVVFRYASVPSGPWEAPESEYEDIFSLESHVVLRTGYKEFWREQVREMVTHRGHASWPRVLETDEGWVNDIIGEWEEFYDEDFTVRSEASHV